MSEFKCEKCDKEFSGQQALDDHNRSKHYVTPKKPIGKKVNKKYVWVLVLIVLVVGYLYFSPAAEIEDGKYNDFATCLTDAGVKMYGAYWCPHCADQKEAFGDSVGLINYVECSLPNNAGQTQVCIDAGIQSYPTWEFEDGTKRAGVLPLEKLAELTGCSLPGDELTDELAVGENSTAIVGDNVDGSNASDVS